MSTGNVHVGGVDVGGGGGGGVGRLIVALRFGASAGPASSLSPCATSSMLPAGTPADPSLGVFSSLCTACARRHDRFQLYSHGPSALAKPSTRSIVAPPAVCHAPAAASISVRCSVDSEAESCAKRNVWATAPTGDDAGVQAMPLGGGHDSGEGMAAAPPLRAGM